MSAQSNPSTGTVTGSANTFPFSNFAPIVQFTPVQPSAVAVPGSHPAAYTYTNNATSTPTVYPIDETGIERTFAKLTEQDIPDLTTKSDRNDWAVTIAVPIPGGLINPTLKGLVYTVKYATTYDNGNAVVQTDTLLTNSGRPVGLVDTAATPSLYHTGSGYAPRLVDGATALCLSSAPAIKCNGGGAQWSHYLDQHWITPNIRLTQNTNLYLNFHVYEYPTEKTARCLSIEVAATWLDDLEERQRRKEEEERKAKEEADRIAVEAAEAAKRAAEELARNAPDTADPGLMQKIEDALANLPPDRRCSSGYAWTLDRARGGYVCTGGGHFISFEEIQASM